MKQITNKSGRYSSKLSLSRNKYSDILEHFKYPSQQYHTNSSTIDSFGLRGLRDKIDEIEVCSNESSVPSDAQACNRKYANNIPIQSPSSHIRYFEQETYD